MKIDEHLKGVLIKCCCLNIIIPRLEKPEIYSQFITGYGLYSLDLVTTARNVAIQSYTLKYVIEMFTT
jgi:hypothetical protein